MTDLRTRTAEMLAFECNPSREEWRKLVADLLAEIDRLTPKNYPSMRHAGIYIENGKVVMYD